MQYGLIFALQNIIRSDIFTRYCVEIPIAGQRAFEGGDIALFASLLKSNNKGVQVHRISSVVFYILLAVPVIVVFTKVDRLQFKEQKRIKKSYVENGMDQKSPTAKAKIDCVAAAAAQYEKSCVQVLKSGLVPPAWMKYCAVSN